MSVSTSGGLSNGMSGEPAITPDGRFVVFASQASNLVAGDTNATGDVFVRDVSSGTTMRVSVGPGGQANGASSTPSLSADGNRVVFQSVATNLVAVDRNGSRVDVFVGDRAAGSVTMVDATGFSGWFNDYNGFTPQAAAARVGRQAMSQDGRYVVFVGHQWEGGGNPCSGTYDQVNPYLFDMATGVMSRVGDPQVIGCYTAAWGTPDARPVNMPSISGDGSVIGYIDLWRQLRLASSVAPGGTRVFPLGPLTGTDPPVSDPWLSRTGVRAVFSTTAANVVAGDSNGRSDVFVVDVGGAPQALSVRPDGGVAATFTGSNGSSGPSISDDGTLAAFSSGASDLVAGDTNSADDAFARGLSAPPPLVGGPLTPAETRGGRNPAEPCTDCMLERAAAADPVATSSGVFSESFTDLATPGRSGGLAVTRTFSSDTAAVAADGPFGFGWQFSYNARLAVNASSGAVTVTQENGSEIVFDAAGSSYRPAAPRIQASLVRNGDSTWTLTRNSTEVLTFDSAGRLTKVQDLNAATASPTYATTLAYNGSGQLATVTDPAGRSYAFGWAGNRISQVQDSSIPPRVVRYAYDGAGNLTDVRGVATTVVGGAPQNDDHWQFGYDSAHRMTTMRSPRFSGDTTTVPSPVVTNHYDGQGRVDWQSDQLGRTTGFDYTTIPGSTIVTSPKENRTLHEFTYGLLVAETRGYGTPGASRWVYAYDPATAGLVSTTDPNGQVSTATWDQAGNMIRATDAVGRTVTATYNSLRRPLTMTDGNGVTTTNTYDAKGNLSSTSTPLRDGDGQPVLAGGVQVVRKTVWNRADAAYPGDVTTMVDPDNKTWAYHYNAAGQVDATTDPAGNKTTWAYNPATGFLESTVTARGNKAGANPAEFRTLFTNDVYGQVRQVKDPLWSATDPVAHQATRTYDRDRNLLTVSDGAANTTEHTYDAAGQLTSTKRPDTTVVATDYDLDGNMVAQVDGNQQATTYDYGAQGRLAFQTDPLGRRTDFAYYPGGQLRTKQDPGGACAATPAVGCTTFTYTAAGQPLTVTYSDGTTPNITATVYDANGRRTQVQRNVNGATKTAYTKWDSLGRMVSSTDEAGATVGYEYNLRDLPTKTTYPGGTKTVTRTWDNAGRPATVQDWLGHTTTYTTDEDSNIVSASTPVGSVSQVDTYGWDKAGQITSTTFKTGTAVLASLAYGRDGKGRLTSETPNPGGWGGRTRAYDYTKLDQLKTAEGSPFAYDTADNLTRQDSGAIHGFDAANQLCFTSTTGSAGTCGAPPAGSTSYTYDTRGNRTTQRPAAGPGVAYTWNQANQLTKTEPVAPAAGSGGFTPLQPARVLDTRPGVNSGVCPGTGCTTIGANQTRTVQVAGQGGVPSTGVAAVVVNLTVVNQQAAGSAVVWPSDVTQPNASSVNWNAGKIVSNLAMIKVAADGTVKITNSSSGTIDVIFDVTGWYATAGTSGAGFTPVVPARVMDTRAGTRTGVCPPTGTCATMGAGATMKVQIAGRGGIPATGVSAVAMNVVVVTPTAAVGSLTLWAGDTPRPATVSIAFNAGGITGELTVTKLAADGTISIYNPYGTTEIALDVAGWFGPAAAGTYQPVTPTRILDTGVPTGTCLTTCAAIPSGGTLVVRVADRGGLPNVQQIAAVAANITVIPTTTTTTGFLHAWPTNTPQPANAFLVFNPGQTAIGNTTVVKPGADGTITLSAYGATVHVVIDLQGWYATPIPTTTYTYDTDGLRATKTTGGTTTTFTWDRSTAIPTLLTDTINTYTYGPDGTPHQQINNTTNQTSWLHHDQLGSTRLITDTNGNTTGAALYAPYGTTTIQIGTTTALGYTGQYTDTETGHIYLRARYYDPTTAQFLTRDPLASQTRSAYGYTGGSPLNRDDPSGLSYRCFRDDRDWVCVDDPVERVASVLSVAHVAECVFATSPHADAIAGGDCGATLAVAAVTAFAPLPITYFATVVDLLSDGVKAPNPNGADVTRGGGPRYTCMHAVGDTRPCYPPKIPIPFKDTASAMACLPGNGQRAAGPGKGTIR